MLESTPDIVLILLLHQLVLYHQHLSGIDPNKIADERRLEPKKGQPTVSIACKI